jgi:hypothetical protein
MVLRWLRLLVLWFLLGIVYFLIEACWRVPQGDCPHWTMIIVGGLCGVAVGGLNQIPRFYRLSVRIQSLIGAALTLAVEFAAGCVLNIWLGLGIWDYSKIPGNIRGQICLPFALVWLVIMPFAIWLEDRLRLGFGWDGRDYTLRSIYKDFIWGEA